ncbi:hypothetical protein D043_0516B, partial [Vibrio parahaemolyticus EKP-021]
IFKLALIALESRSNTFALNGI